MSDQPCCFHGPRVTIRPLQRRDLDTMSAWEPFDDPLYRLFDWPKRTSREDDRWFQHLLRDQTRVYYAVEDQAQNLIGRISLREIKDGRSARLGIGFGKDFVGQGYGTEALQVFLRYYFLDLGFQRMVLDVAAINMRAIRCYRRCGFTYVGSHYQYAGSDADLAFLRDERYRHLSRFMKRDRYRNLMLAYDMVLDRKDWLELQESEKAESGTSLCRSASMRPSLPTSANAR